MVFFLILEAIELEVCFHPSLDDQVHMIEQLLRFNVLFLKQDLENHLDLVLDLDLDLGKIGERKSMSLVLLIRVCLFIYNQEIQYYL